MSIDLQLLSRKLIHMRTTHDLLLDDVSSRTGIPLERVAAFERSELEPFGDEVLIISDLYSCDYKYFISNEKFVSIDKADQLFRMVGKDMSPEDKLSISQFLLLCENEYYISDLLSQKPGQIPKLPDHIYSDTFYKRQGQNAALFLREFLGLQDLSIVPDVYSVVRKLGIHLFRRKLQSSSISGIYISHPKIGDCVLVNYEDDIFRQRFTAMHELAHAIFDSDLELVISAETGQWSTEKLREIRADNFAATFLCSSAMIAKIPEPSVWNKDKVIDFTTRLRISTTALAIALENNGAVGSDLSTFIKSVRIPYELKFDPEFDGLDNVAKNRKQHLLELGLSHSYVKLCTDGYYNNHISIGCLADMLMVDTSGLQEIADLYKFRL